MNKDMPLVLYRATVGALADLASPAPLGDSEYFIFFEARRSHSTKVLEALLHHAWQVDPATLMVNICSAHELAEDFAMGPASDGEVRLFEDGYDAQHIFYIDPARTQFFLRPQTQARLQPAQFESARRRMEHHARRAFDVARRASDRQWIERHSLTARGAA